MNKTLKTIVYAAAVILVLAVTLCVKAFVFGNFTVKGDSMKDTLFDGDVVWAAKLAVPTYGDIILIEDGDTNLVKRAVGFAGDKLWMERDFGQTGSKWYLCRKKSGSDVVERLVEEKYKDAVMPHFDLEINTCHPLTNNAGEGAFDEQSAFVVPEDCVYALGDNRNISSDSRSRGAFPLDDVIGVVKAKGMTLVYALIAAIAVVLVVFLIVDAAKSRKAEAAGQKQAAEATESADAFKDGGSPDGGAVAPDQSSAEDENGLQPPKNEE